MEVTVHYSEADMVAFADDWFHHTSEGRQWLQAQRKGSAAAAIALLVVGVCLQSPHIPLVGAGALAVWNLSLRAWVRQHYRRWFRNPKNGLKSEQRFTLDHAGMHFHYPQGAYTIFWTHIGEPIVTPSYVQVAAHDSPLVIPVSAFGSVESRDAFLALVARYRSGASPTPNAWYRSKDATEAVSFAKEMTGQ